MSLTRVQELTMARSFAFPTFLTACDVCGRSEDQLDEI